MFYTSRIVQSSDPTSNLFSLQVSYQKYVNFYRRSISHVPLVEESYYSLEILKEVSRCVIKTIH